MTGPILTVLLLALLSVGFIVAGVYLIAGTGAALITLGFFTAAASAVIARGAYRAPGA